MRIPHLARVLRAAAAGALALALAGCFTVDVDLVIEEDTVTGTVLLALDAALQDELDPDEVFSGWEESYGALPGVTVVPYDDPARIGSQLRFDQVTLDDLNEAAEGDPERLRILRNRPAGRYEFRLVIDLRWMDELTAAPPDPSDPPDPEASPDPEGSLADRLAGADLTVRVTFPGRVIEHNGDTMSERSVTWYPQPHRRTELRALAQDPDATPDWLRWWPVGLAAAAAAVLAAGGVTGWLVVRARRHRALAARLGWRP